MLARVVCLLLFCGVAGAADGQAAPFGDIVFAVTTRSTFAPWEVQVTLDRMPVFILYSDGHYFMTKVVPANSSRHSRIVVTGVLSPSEVEHWKAHVARLDAVAWEIPKLIDLRVTDGSNWYFYFALFREPVFVQVYYLIPDGDDPEYPPLSHEVRQFREFVRDLFALEGVPYTPDKVTLSLFRLSEAEIRSAKQAPVHLSPHLQQILSQYIAQNPLDDLTLREISLNGPAAVEANSLLRGHCFYSGHTPSALLRIGKSLYWATLRIEFPLFEDHLKMLQQHYETQHRHSHGNRTTQTSLAGPDTYTYDPLNRLTAATHPTQPTESYHYDPVGNRTTSHLSATPTYDAANRLLSDDHFTDTYDANGNLRTKTEKATGEVTTFTYDPEDQLVGVTTAVPPFAPTLSVSYHYDGLGRRWAKRVNGTPIAFMYDGEDVVRLLDRTRRHVAEIHHGPGIDEPLLLRDPATGETLTYLPDGLGSIIMLVRADGSVAQTYLYDAFGRVIGQAGVIAQPFTFTGREYDQETGLYFYRNRYLDPQTGRFIQADPRINLYWYADANPVTNTDPFGLYVSPELIRRYPGIMTSIDIAKAALARGPPGIDPRTQERMLRMFTRLVDDPTQPTIKLKAYPDFGEGEPWGAFTIARPHRIALTPAGILQAEKGFLPKSGGGKFHANPEEIVAFLVLHEFFHYYLKHTGDPQWGNNYIVNEYTVSFLPSFRGVLQFTEKGALIR